MAEHTPGPWEIYTQLGKPVAIGRRGNGIICESPSGSKQAVDNFAANARLIAAAPELLEALDKVESELERLESATGTLADEKVILDIRAALAKARGTA